MDQDYRKTVQVNNDLSEANAREAHFVDSERIFMNRVYNWMTGGLAISGLVAWWVSQEMIRNTASVFRDPKVFLGLFVLELILVGVLSLAVGKLPTIAAGICFLVYSVLSGATLAPIFLAYTSSSIFAAFFTCAGTFAITSIYGYMTRRRLDSIGTLCMMGLFGLIIASLVNWFLHSSGLEIAITYLGVVIFVGLTAWDTQKLRQLAEGMDESGVYSDPMKKAAIVGALALYLDFVNLFLMLLRLFGRRN